MAEHVSQLTLFINHLFGKFALALLTALHITPTNPQTPIPEQVVMGGVVFVLVALLTLWLRSRLSVERPGAAQQVAEFLLTNPPKFGIRDVLDENAGHDAREYLGMVGSVSVFILFSNLLSLIPAFSSPTGHPSVPLACALVTFFYFNYAGIRALGPGGYVQSLSGPVWWLVPLILPVEIISTCARLMSLTVRLWANMFSSELIYVMFLGLLAGPVEYFAQKNAALAVILGVFPFTIPLAFIGLHIFVAVIQTYVFTILPAVYLGLATAEEH
jgi:F-type H+-transporting ATPase subunit a